MNIPREHLYGPFEVVFKTYYNSLCNYAFTFVKSAHLSEDIVQETFVRIWEDRPELIGSDGLRYYLFTAVRNNCISHLRKKKHQLVEWNDDHAAGHDSIVEKDAAGEADRMSVLDTAIEGLPPKCREVFLLSRISNMTYKEIAASLGISEKTVENQLGKALKVMRRFLKEKGLFVIWGFLNYFL